MLWSTSELKWGFGRTLYNYCVNLMVTKVLSGWGFFVKQGATTIHESVQLSWPQPLAWLEVEAVTHPEEVNQTTHAIIHTDSVSSLQKVKAQTEMGQGSTSTLENSCRCTALDMLEWREMTKQIDWQTKHHNWLVSQKIWNVEELQTLLVGKKPMTSHHRSPHWERHGKGKH